MIPVSSLSLAAQRKYIKGKLPQKDVQPIPPAEYRIRIEDYEKTPANLKRMAQEAAAAVDAFNELHETGLPVATVVASLMKSHSISKSTLWRYRKTVEGHDRQYWEALLCPNYRGGRGKNAFTPEAYEVIKRNFFSQSEPPLTAVLVDMKEDAHRNGWVIPSEKTVMNRLKDEPAYWWQYRDGGETAIERSYPTTWRSYASLRIHEFWESDGRRADVLCIWPDGSKGRPVKVIWRECRTRMPLAIGLYKNEDAELIVNTFGQALTITGTRPEKLKIDNGPAYAVKHFTGQQKTRYRYKIKEGEPFGITTRIGVKVYWSKPHKGRDKPVESFWNYIANHCDKNPRFEKAYRGRNPAEKPDNVDNDHAIPIEEYAEQLRKAVWRFSTSAHRGNGMNERKPLELYNELMKDHVKKPVDNQIINLCRMGVAIIQPDKKDAVLAFKVEGYGRLRYWSEELALLPMQTRDKKLHVYYDLNDPSRPVSVYDGEMLLCEAFHLGNMRIPRKLDSDSI